MGVPDDELVRSDGNVARMPRQLLDVRAITKVYPPGLVALQGVSLSVNEGEVVGLLGPNGAGKSSLVKILTGVERRTDGELCVDGHIVDKFNASEAARWGIIAIHQELPLFGSLSAADNVGIRNVRRHILAPWPGRDLVGVYKKYSEGIHGVPPPTARLRDLSVRDRQIVAFVRALSFEPRLLVVDEGTSSVALDERRMIYQTIRRISRERSIGVIYVTHFIDDALAVSDRVVVLRNGRVAMESEVRNETGVQVLNEEQVIAAMTEKGVPSSGSSEGRTRNSGSGGLVACNQEEVHGGQAALDAPVLIIEGLRTRGAGPVSFSVREGERLGLYGAPGCGAEEVLTAIGGFIHHRGSICWRGWRLDRSSAARRRHGIVYVTGDRGKATMPMWSVAENVRLSALAESRWHHFAPLAQASSAAKALLDRMGAIGNPASTFGSLSGGNQQKVIIGMAMSAGNRPLLLAHDLTRGVDVTGRTEIYRIIQSAEAANMTLIMYSTDPEELVELCSRVLIFQEGFVCREIGDAVLSSEALTTAALTRQESTVRSIGRLGLTEYARSIAER